MSTIDMDKLKKCEVEILKEFLFACKVLNLQYYVIGGTLLGTVRHKGFIPWDDDIDVGMPRQDYNVFVREGQKHMNSRFFVQTHESDPEYLNGFAKVRDSGTTFIETSAKNAKINHGIYIDVFPLDDYDMSKNRGFQLRKRFIEERIRMESIPISQVPLRGKMVRPFVKLRYPTADTVCRARDTLFQSMPQGDYMANHCGAWRGKRNHSGLLVRGRNTPGI